jgi:uncharacterized membrane protein YgdD (TMEM256/DUF423 family)
MHRDATGVFVLAGFLFFGGLIQFMGALAMLRARGEYKSTIGRQLAAAFGPRGGVLFLLVIGTVLVAFSVYLMVRLATR